ncbi:Bgt-2713 [Blumeria graminis f. sp. tritici]|uniref:Bgt-2713 n=2 Tax=Blumeria graminis f. sp. tritici TaxID=62690 RepID=A0A061HMW7_BLUGR|nr:hypothetical protein BGT96224_2713 [Blumeria graminis f. sp. tritici 96224]VCU41202.1 Bgt-2713 [Blumeria graminis f. sp. tritici]
MGESSQFLASRKVWTTLITNTQYLPGLLTLAFSLEKQNSKYPLVALYTDGFPSKGQAILAARGILTQRIEYLKPKGDVDYSKDPRFHDCWSKLTPFGLLEYDRVVQLDSDMVVLRNMDELMDLELDAPELNGMGVRVFAAGHACICNPLKKTHYPEDWIRENCAFTTQHSTPLIAQTIAPPTNASPLGFINGGLQVVNPSRAVFNLILAHLESDAVLKADFADQSLLSDLFKNRWVPLPYVYNALKTLRWPGVHAEIWRDDEVKNIHYILTPKPWEEVDDTGRNTSHDPTHALWIAVNAERLASEQVRNIPPYYL